MAKSYLDKDGLLYFLQKIRPSATPLMDGTASTGTSKRFAAEDHVHPSDTTKAPLASPALTGTPTAPTATTGTATTQIATTEFVANTVGAMTSGVADVQVDNASVVTSGIAKINTFTGATSSAAGTKGLVPAPPKMSSNSQIKALCNNGEWRGVVPSFDQPVSGTYVGCVTLTLAGIQRDIPSATTSNDGAMSSSDKTKLNGIASGATAVAISVGGGSSTITSTNASGTASSVEVMNSSMRGAANGVAPLNSSSKIDSSYLPSYVDDVIEAYPRSGQTELSQNWLSLTSSGSALTPEAGKIYILMADSTSYATNTQFRWGGSAYVKMNDGGVSAITNAEIDIIVAS